MDWSLFFTIRSFLGSRRYPASHFIRQRTIRMAEIHWEITVARATPATPMDRAMTKNRFRTTLMTPAVSRK